MPHPVSEIMTKKNLTTKESLTGDYSLSLAEDKFRYFYAMEQHALNYMNVQDRERLSYYRNMYADRVKQESSLLGTPVKSLRFIDQGYVFDPSRESEPRIFEIQKQGKIYPLEGVQTWLQAARHRAKEDKKTVIAQAIPILPAPTLATVSVQTQDIVKNDTEKVNAMPVKVNAMPVKVTSGLINSKLLMVGFAGLIGLYVISRISKRKNR